MEESWRNVYGQGLATCRALVVIRRNGVGSTTDGFTPLTNDFHFNKTSSHVQNISTISQK